MRIAIAGANSFIGKRIIAINSEKQSHEITAIVRDADNNKVFWGRYPDVHVIECSMENYERLGSLTGTGDCFIDLSWEGSRGDARQNHELQKFDYTCSMAAMRSMAEAGYSILVSAGSQAEYGQIDGVITEETRPNPNTEYGKYKLQIFDDTKRLAEEKNIRFIEPRYFSLYGPGDYEKTLIMTCISKMITGEDIILNPCTQLWDYMYVDDAVEGLLKLIENTNAFGAYNFATGIHRPIREFVLEMREVLESKSHIEFSDISSYQGLIFNLRPAVDKLFDATGAWKPRFDFKDGIKKIIETRQ